MKKLLLLLSAVGMIFTACEKVDLSDIYDRLDTVENQLGISHDFNNKIYYTTSDGKKLFPKTDASLYGAILISNTYKDGQGVLVFDDVVTSIGDGAFSDCTSLKSITIGNGVTSIGNSAFYECSRLTSITIPDSVTSIGGSAFYDCEGLTSVTIPDSVTSIGNSAFSDCSSLKEVYCKPTTPPTGGSHMFSYKYIGYEPIGCKIYVPRNSVSAYKSASGWSAYASDIEGYDF